MTIRFACPSCGRRLVSNDKKVGRSTNCPACGGAVTVPSQWYLLVDDREAGPYSGEMLQAMAAAGRISPSSTAREADKSYFVETGRLAFLADAFPIESSAVVLEAPEPVVDSSLVFAPRSYSRKRSRLLPVAAIGSALVIVGVPLIIAILSFQSQEKPEVVAHAPQRLRAPILAPVAKEASEPSTPTRKPQEPSEPGPKASKSDERRIPEAKESAPSARDVLDLPRDMARSAPPENIEPTETPARILQDQNDDARDDAKTGAPAQPASPSPLSKKDPRKAPEPTFQPPSWLPTRQVTATVMYKLHFSSQPSDQFRVRLNLPRTFPGRQVIREMTFKPDPTEMVEESGDRFAQFELAHPSDGAVIYVRFVADLYEADLTTATQLPTRLRQLAIPDRDRWLRDEPLIETNDPLIKQAAKTIAGNNEIQTITGMLNGMALTMSYDAQPGELGAVGLLKAGTGKCADFANLFVAICRAKHIPARPCNGFTTKPVTKDQTAFHRWAEVYLRGYGWVPIDPTWARTGHHPWETMEPVRVCESYNPLTYKYTKQQGSVSIEPTVKVASDRWVKPNAVRK
jgi:transglutaminase-like putative cysteine protease